MPIPRKKILIFSFIVILIIASALFFLKNKIGADVLKTVDRESDARTKPTIPLVILENDYSREEIQNALSSFQELKKKEISSISDQKSRQILTEIEQKKTELVKAQLEKFNLTNPKSQIATNNFFDVVYAIADKKNEIISIPQLEDAVATKNIQDNFNFAPNIPGWLKNDAYEMYQKIENLMGPRTRSGQIYVRFGEQAMGTYGNLVLEISHSLDDSNFAKYVIAHELVHAFQDQADGGYGNYSEYWPTEGMAEAVGSIAVRDIFTDLDMQNRYSSVGLASAESALEQPNLGNEYFWSRYINSYTLGSTVFMKIYRENPDVFKELSRLRANSSSNSMIHNICQTVKKIENKVCGEWFTQKSLYINFPKDEILQQSAEIGSSYYIMANDSFQSNTPSSLLGDTSWLNLMLGGREQSVVVTAYDYRDARVAEWKMNADHDIARTFISNDFPSEGFLKLELNIDNNTNQKVIQYFYSRASGADSSMKNDIYGLVIGEGDRIRVSRLNPANDSATWSSTVSVINKSYKISAEEIGQGGKFKLEVFNQSAAGTILDQKIFYKENYLYYFAPFITSNQQNCDLQLNASRISANDRVDYLSANFSGSETCGMVLIVNDLPMVKTFGDAAEQRIYNVAKKFDSEVQLAGHDYSTQPYKTALHLAKFLPSQSGTISNGSFNDGLKMWQSKIIMPNGIDINTTFANDRPDMYVTYDRYACATERCFFINSGVGQNTVLSQRIGFLSNNKQYRLSLLATGANTGVTAMLYDSTDKKSYWVKSAVNGLNQQITKTVSTGAKGAHIWYVIIYGPSGPHEQLYIDDISLEQLN